MSLLAEDSVITSATAKKTAPYNTAAAKSLLALALHGWIQCVLAVVLAALLLLGRRPRLPWMAASLYLHCAMTARLLAHLPPPDRARELREKSRKQDFVEVDRVGAPGGFDDASSAEGEHGETSERAGGYEFSFGGEDDSGDPCNSEQRRFFFVESYCKSVSIYFYLDYFYHFLQPFISALYSWQIDAMHSDMFMQFYDLLVFLRSTERRQWR
jgi:hypothetical protein